MSEMDYMKSIYVGNLPFTASEDEVRDLFTPFGEVESVRLPRSAVVLRPGDRDTGRPRGFGFVKMPADDADAAIKALDGQPFGGRNLRINEAEERKGPGGFGGPGGAGRGPRPAKRW